MKTMTPNKEDYLKCIHEIGEQNVKITNKAIAEMMQVSAPAASEMLKKMMSDQLIEKDTRLGYQLTPQGLLLTSELYRKHRIIEVFLIHHLGYSIDEIHQEAEVLEHTVSDTFIERLEELLDYPQFCPHGGTIPKKNELLVEKNHVTLKESHDLGYYTVCRVRDEFHLLNYLKAYTLMIGEVFELITVDNFAKTYTINYNQHTLTIPDTIAQQIYVTKLKDKDSKKE